MGLTDDFCEEIDIIMIDRTFIQSPCILFLQCLEHTFRKCGICINVNVLQLMVNRGDLPSALVKKLSLIIEILRAIDQARKNHKN